MARRVTSRKIERAQVALLVLLDCEGLTVRQRVDIEQAISTVNELANIA